MGFFGDKKMPDHGAVDTIIGHNAKIKGELVSAGSVTINGLFEGSISVEGELILAPGGRVVGDIKGSVVIIAGVVDGNVSAAEKIEIAQNGKVLGNLVGGKIVIDDEASYSGKVKVTKSDETSKSIEETISILEP